MVITGKVLREMRQEAGMSQQELARLAGITQAHVAKIESGRVDPRLSTVNRLVSILNEEETGTQCSDIMTRNIVSVRMDEPVEKVVKIMRSFDISQLPVFDGEQQVGSVRESTIMRNLDRKLNVLEVRHLVDRPFPVVDGRDSVGILAPLLDFHPAVLVSEKGKLSGIITKSDLLGVK